MGCDINSAVEVFDGEKWNWMKDTIFSHGNGFTNEPFDWRSYRMFGFLGNVYKRDDIIHLSDYRGLPKDLSKELDQGEFSFSNDLWLGEFGFSYLLLSELLNFDYNKKLLVNGENQTYKDYLGERFFEEIEIMEKLSEDPNKIRIVFGFDN